MASCRGLVIDKVPFLGDIPGIGLLFQHSVKTKTKTELLIFLTPHVAQVPDDLKSMAESEKAGTKIVQDAVGPGVFQDHLKGLELGASTRPATPDADLAPDTVEPQPLPTGDSK